MRNLESEKEWVAAKNSNPRRNGFKRNMLMAGHGHARGPRTTERRHGPSCTATCGPRERERVGVGRGPRADAWPGPRAARPRGRGPRGRLAVGRGPGVHNTYYYGSFLQAFCTSASGLAQALRADHVYMTRNEERLRHTFLLLLRKAHNPGHLELHTVLRNDRPAKQSTSGAANTPPPSHSHTGKHARDASMAAWATSGDAGAECE